VSAPQPIILLMFVSLGAMLGIAIWPTHKVVAVLFGLCLIGLGLIVQTWADKRNDKKD
jgi:uncharacterized membrane protein YqjE